LLIREIKFRENFFP